MNRSTSTPKRPVWLLDFDGVINAVERKADSGPDRSVWPDWVRVGIAFADSADTTAEKWTIHYSPTVVATVADAVEAGVEVIWLSTWQQWTVNFAAAIPGLPELPYLAGHVPDNSDPAGSPSGGRWWKTTLAQTHTDPSRPLLWTDDDLRFANDAQEWMRARKSPSLLLAPREHIGLAPRLLRAVRNFLDLSPG